MVNLFGPSVNGYGIDIEIERLDFDLDNPNPESKIWKNQVMRPVPEGGGNMESTFVDRERLARTFSELVRIDSVSREEGRICRHQGRTAIALRPYGYGGARSGSSTCIQGWCICQPWGDDSGCGR